VAAVVASASPSSSARASPARLLGTIGPVIADAAVDEHRPDAAVVDVRVPPGHTDEGLQAAIAIRRDHPMVEVLMLSQHIETRYTAELLGAASGGGAADVGYLLKDRVADVDEFVETLSRVAAGGTAPGPEVVTQLMGASRRLGRLALMAEGRSNAAIAGILVIPSGPPRSTSGTSSASSAWHPRTPTTAGCWPSSDTWSPEHPFGILAPQRLVERAGVPASGPPRRPLLTK
jgi:hypothetical protein